MGFLFVDDRNVLYIHSMHNILDYIEHRKNLKDIPDEMLDEVMPILAQQLSKVDYRIQHTDGVLKKDWSGLVKYTPTSTHTASQVRHGIKLVEHFYPNFYMIESNGKSFHSSWNPEVLEKVLRWCRTGMSKLWLSWARRAVYFSAGLPSSTMYRPHIAKTACLVSNKPFGTLLDPCIGWGGRMLGTVSAGWDYIGFDTNPETFQNTQRLVEFLGIQSKVKLFLDDSINMDKYDFQSADIALTSPPYYDVEIYSEFDNRQYSQYPTYRDWVTGWLSPLIGKSLDRLNEDGMSCWNVQNMPSKKMMMVDDVESVHNSRGWNLVDTLGITSPVRNLRLANKKIPDSTFIFRK
jgi:hypothetical protein